MHVRPLRRPPLLAVLAAVVALVTGLVVPVTATSAYAATCPCTIFASTATPANSADSDTSAVELGVKFQSDVDGYVTGVRFYKGTGNTGTHIGNLWAADGTQLATATFTNETASGWQQVTFNAPVAVKAGTTYIASYHTNVGHYAYDAGYFASAPVDNAPLHALQDGTDGGNGVYAYADSTTFPNQSYNSDNYWVDVAFRQTATDTVPPTVSSTDPVSGATGVEPSATASATFSEAVQSSTVNFTLSTSGGAAVAGTTSYSSATNTATFTPSAALAYSTTYTASVSGAKDSAGNTMAGTTSWSFTTTAPPGTCPCSLWPASATPATANSADDSAVELGVRFSSDVSGYVTALKFYKGSSNTGTHEGHLWTSQGQLLATATFSDESASGWQTVTLPSPVAVTAGTTYVASYHTATGYYSSSGAYFASKGQDASPLHAPQDGSGAANGVYVYGGGAFPTFTYNSTNYWVDVVFNRTASDTVPPTLTGQSPGNGAAGAPTSTAPSVVFSEAVQPSTIAWSVAGPSGAVSGTPSYDSSSDTATFTPAAVLASGTTYTVTVSGAKDLAGNTMSPVTWSFTTAIARNVALDKGPGGPILLLTNTADPFSSYYAEILRNEGLNEFDTESVANVTAADLSSHDVVVLGETSLTSTQVALLTDWVTAGGSLIAMRPDQQLAGLLGLQPASGTLSEGYLKLSSSLQAAAGITQSTMQFHGAADLYTLGSATSAATLYSDAMTATSSPAVSLNAVGSNGGQAAAFTFDLAESIVRTRQGNPAWAGQHRDGQAGPVRSDDQFFGGTTSDYVDLSKVSVPQADEQQRLFANLVITMDRHRMPLPRFWYFPRDLKAVIVGTGDDHGNGGTSGRFDEYLANSPAGCSVSAWTCLRFTSYIFPGTPISDSDATTYQGKGFEVGLHTTTNCSDYTTDSLDSDFTSQLSQLASQLPDVNKPQTNRTHCIAWSDFVGEPTAELNHNIRLDTNYYYWPGSWVNDRPGFFTGSGMPMRFAQADGTMIDVYQATSQMTDESDQSFPYTPSTLLDNALDPTLGYYGAFTANMHTDQAETYDSDQLIASAQSHNVPIISAKQLLTWLDGRNASSFKGLSWSGSSLTFTVAPGTGTSGLTAMIPAQSANGTLQALTSGGAAVPYTTETIKGLTYAVFQPSAATYVATYGAGGTATATATGSTGSGSTSLLSDVAGTSGAPRRGAGATPLHPASAATIATSKSPAAAKNPAGGTATSAPSLSAVTARPLPGGLAVITWKSDQDATGVVTFGASGTSLNGKAYAYGKGVFHWAVLTDLDQGKTYAYQVTSTNSSGSTTSPVKKVTAREYGVSDATSASFRTGTDSGTAVTQVTDYADAVVALAKSGSGYSSSGTFTSRILDAGQMVNWGRAQWLAYTPVKSTLTVSVRTGSVSKPDASWTAWQTVKQNGASIRPLTKGSRYIQYRVQMTTSSSSVTPLFNSIGFTSTGRPLPFISEE